MENCDAVKCYLALLNGSAVVGQAGLPVTNEHLFVSNVLLEALAAAVSTRDCVFAHASFFNASAQLDKLSATGDAENPAVIHLCLSSQV